jgi:hypothetical protein
MRLYRCHSIWWVAPSIDLSVSCLWNPYYSTQYKPELKARRTAEFFLIFPEINQGEFRSHVCFTTAPSDGATVWKTSPPGHQTLPETLPGILHIKINIIFWLKQDVGNLDLGIYSYCKIYFASVLVSLIKTLGCSYIFTEMITNNLYSLNKSFACFASFLVCQY